MRGKYGVGNVNNPLNPVSTEAAGLIESFSRQDRDVQRGDNIVPIQGPNKVILEQFSEVAKAPGANYNDLIGFIEKQRASIREFVDNTPKMTDKLALEKMADESIGLLNRALMRAAKRDGLEELVSASLYLRGSGQGR